MNSKNLTLRADRVTLWGRTAQLLWVLITCGAQSPTLCRSVWWQNSWESSYSDWTSLKLHFKMHSFHKHLHSVTNPAEDFHTSKKGCTTHWFGESWINRLIEQPRLEGPIISAILLPKFLQHHHHHHLHESCSPFMRSRMKQSLSGVWKA